MFPLLLFFLLFSAHGDEYLGPSRHEACRPGEPDYVAEFEKAKSLSAARSDYPIEEVIKLRVLALSVRHDSSNRMVTSAEEAASLFNMLNVVYRPTGIEFEMLYQPLPSLPAKYAGKQINGPSCHAEKIGDGVCDCHREEGGDWSCCSRDLEDGGDCFNEERIASLVEQCSDGVAGNGESNNGVCDKECNYAQAGWDGGDCCLDSAPDIAGVAIACRQRELSKSLQQRLAGQSMGYSEKEFYSWIAKEGAPQWDELPSLKILFSPGGIVSWALFSSSPSRDHWFARALISVDPYFSPISKLPTLIHEVGHLLSLPHTFVYCSQGKTDGGDQFHRYREYESSWSGGDFIADTVAMPHGPTRSCRFEFNYPESETRKQCEYDEGNLHELFAEARKKPYGLGNWMSYGACARLQGHFTPGQAALMRCAARHVFFREQVPPVVPTDGSEICVPSAAAESRFVVPAHFPQSDWISPKPNALLDVGAQLSLQFAGQLAAKLSSSFQKCRVAIIRSAMANVLRCQEAEQSDFTTAQSAFSPFMDPITVYEGEQLPSSISLAYASGAVLTKGQFSLIIEITSPSGEKVERLFSPPFWLGYRTCSHGDDWPLIGVCRPAAECAAFAETFVADDAAECGNGVVCCVSGGRNLMETNTELFGVGAGEVESFTGDLLPDERAALPESVLGKSTSTFAMRAPPDALLFFRGAAFIGAPVKLSFDGRPLVADFRISDRASLVQLLLSKGMREEAAALPTDLSVAAVVHECSKHGLMLACLGRSSALPRVRLIGLELLPFGDGGAEMSPIDLISEARASAPENRVTIDNEPAGTLLLRVPLDLPERLVYIRAEFQTPSGKEERFSASFELNFAPCSGHAEAAGTCRPRSSCSSEFSLNDGQQTGCETFDTQIGCCLNDATSVLGQYKAGLLDAATPSESVSIWPMTTGIIVAAVGVVLFSFIAAAIVLLIRKRRRSSSVEQRAAEQPRRTRRTTSGASTHRRRLSTTRNRSVRLSTGFTSIDKRIQL